MDHPGPEDAMWAARVCIGLVSPEAQCLSWNVPAVCWVLALETLASNPAAAWPQVQRTWQMSSDPI